VKKGSKGRKESKEERKEGKEGRQGVKEGRREAGKYLAVTVCIPAGCSKGRNKEQERTERMV
jgi:hypothetical protein